MTLSPWEGGQQEVVVPLADKPDNGTGKRWSVGNGCEAAWMAQISWISCHPETGAKVLKSTKDMAEDIWDDQPWLLQLSQNGYHNMYHTSHKTDTEANVLFVFKVLPAKCTDYGVKWLLMMAYASSSASSELSIICEIDNHEPPYRKEVTVNVTAFNEERAEARQKLVQEMRQKRLEMMMLSQQKAEAERRERLQREEEVHFKLAMRGIALSKQDAETGYQRVVHHMSRNSNYDVKVAKSILHMVNTSGTNTPATKARGTPASRLQKICDTMKSSTSASDADSSH